MTRRKRLISVFGEGSRQSKELAKGLMPDNQRVCDSTGIEPSIPMPPLRSPCGSVRGATSPCTKKQKEAKSGGLYLFFWCGRRELNPYGKTTRPSNVRVCQFRHSRRTLMIIPNKKAFVNTFFEIFKTFFDFFEKMQRKSASE